MEKCGVWGLRNRWGSFDLETTDGHWAWHRREELASQGGGAFDLSDIEIQVLMCIDNDWGCKLEQEMG